MVIDNLNGLMDEKEKFSAILVLWFKIWRRQHFQRLYFSFNKVKVRGKNLINLCVVRRMIHNVLILAVYLYFTAHHE